MNKLNTHQNSEETAESGFISRNISLPLEIRVHGRGGQGGVTCAKLIAATYAQLDFHVQTFGDYGAERTGAPIRAFTRIDRNTIKNRNKVYWPDHLLVLDKGLLGPSLLDGVSEGASLLINSSETPASLRKHYPQYRLAVVDATGIARKYGIGTSAVVIINTTIVGAYAAFTGLPLEAVRRAFEFFNFGDDFEAAQAASEAVAIFDYSGKRSAKKTEVTPKSSPDTEVLPLTSHLKDIPTALKTGAWSTQTPIYQEYAAPCSIACPAGNDVVGFIQMLKEKGVTAAAELLLQTQPLPAVCGRVCPAPCMHACNREYYDGPVNIRSLERWIADNDETKPVPMEDPKPLSFAVIGSGPAGLSAAYYLAMQGQQVSLLEKEGSLGGVLRTGIPEYRLPEQILDRDIDRIVGLGVETICSSPVSKEDITRLLKDYDGVIVCKGLGLAFSLEATGSNLPGVQQGLDFLQENKQSVAQLSGNVLVIGGGNTAIDCARSALRSGASSVKLIYRRSRAEMPAISEEIEEAIREGVQILTQRQPVAFIGDDRIRGVLLAEVDLGPEDEDGRRKPLVTERTVELDCDTVLLALGQEKDLDLVPAGAKIKGNQAWDKDSPLHLWFAGDCLTGDGTVAHAIGNGRRTALAALATCRGEEQPSEKSFKSTVAPAHIRFSHFPVIPPHQDRHRPSTSWHNNFEEVNQGLPGPGEAERCFSCGRCTHCDTCLVYCPDGIIFREGKDYRIDQEYCKGCGICVAECPRRAMEMIDK
ncbi:MAG: FAD-dependent oxidoreductase [Desulfocapsaceae bacterium]|nr:FAD-dependent oxidoreductase [Desulfocapsaceae bacterium]